jgi:hypothetical protein
MVILKQAQIPVNKNALKLMTAIWTRQKLRGMRNGSIRHIIPVMALDEWYVDCEIW